MIIHIAALVALLAPLLIVIGQVTNGVGSILKLVGALPDTTTKAQQAFETVSGVLSGVFSGAINAVNTGITFLLSNPFVLLIAAIVALVALIATKGDEIQAILQKVDDFLQGVFATDWEEIFGPLLGGALNNFFGVVKDVWDGVKTILDGIIDFIRGVFTADWERAWNGVKEIFKGIFDSLKGLLRPPINAIITMINAAIGGINAIIEGINKIPGFDDIPTIGKIPLLAKGGEVLRGSAIVGEAGPELLTVMGDRTIVQPLTNNTTNHSTHLGGVSIAVYGAPGQDVRELAEIMMEEMQQIYDREEAALR